MHNEMSQKTKREVMERLRSNYAKAGPEYKSELIAQAIGLLGYHRKAAIRALNWKKPPVRAPAVVLGRPREYEPERLLKVLTGAKHSTVLPSNSRIGCRGWIELPMSREIDSVLPQGARAKARSSPPAHFISKRKLGKSQQPKPKQKSIYTDFFTKPDATNNLAERQLRPAVIARKVSCGNKTSLGAHTWEILASLSATCVQRAESFANLVSQAAPLSYGR
jgi:hypothetical protein